MTFSLDHIAVVFEDLDAGQTLYKRLGFQLTKRSAHAGSITPGGPVVPWGSANQCAMLSQGYLEVLGVTDPALHSNAKAMLAKYAGAHIVALGCDDAALAAAQARSRGAAVADPIDLQRQASFGQTGETRLAQFRNAYGDATTYPEGRLILIEHRTPEVLWQPQLMRHPNTARALTDIWMAVADRVEAAGRYEKLLGVAPSVADGESVFKLAGGALRILDQAGLARLAPGFPPPQLPFVAGFGIAVESRQTACELLLRSGVPLRREGQAFWVDPEDAGGCAIRIMELSA